MTAQNSAKSTALVVQRIITLSNMRIPTGIKRCVGIISGKKKSFIATERVIYEQQLHRTNARGSG
jgi:hypothetical protein